MNNSQSPVCLNPEQIIFTHYKNKQTILQSSQRRSRKQTVLGKELESKTKKSEQLLRKEIKGKMKGNRTEDKKKRDEEYFDLNLKVYLLDKKKERLKKQFYDIVNHF